MDQVEAQALLDMIDSSASSAEERRKKSSTNRRGQMGMVIANAQLASDISTQDDTLAILEAVAPMLSDPL